ncbi:MAG: tetratricopeptide repeat protein [Deltaproteobacteria bacterium]|nr:tetratricopeptide repeat protein [Deltaproteobacteria bacterium]
MKKLVTVYFLILLILVPIPGMADDRCDRISIEMESVLNQINELNEQFTSRITKGETISDAEGKQHTQKMKALTDKNASLSKKWTECMGMPTTQEEAAKVEAQQLEDMNQAMKTFESNVREAGVNEAMMGASGGAGQVVMPPLQEPVFTPQPDASGGLPGNGSGRTPEQRALAVAAVNAELDRMPLILPKKENAPDKTAILKIAKDRNTESSKQLQSDDLFAYTTAINWEPDFKGLSPNPDKAKKYSIVVSSATNYFDKPHFIIAFASAVFSLDPKSTTNANNFASAIITAGERLSHDKTSTREIATFSRDAEACFLYAIAISMKEDAWTDESITSIINLGNLYIDMGRLEEARSLFSIARKQSQFSWDAALGMAAYFYAVGKPDKAIAILEDDNLDKPVSLQVAKKAAKALEKSEDVPLESPDAVYEANIKAINSEPIITAADFMSQIDQNARNKLRYFIENLPSKGSFKAPPIKTLTQFASLKAISAPPGVSALKDFREMLQIYSMSSYAAMGSEQLKMLTGLGLDVDMGVDLDDVARHPEKYINSKNKSKVKVDKTKLLANIEEWKKMAKGSETGLAAGKTDGILGLVANTDPSFNILRMDPNNYADPMNIIIQKYNFAVYNRKSNLYNGYLYSVNKRMYNAMKEIIAQYERKIEDAGKIRSAQLADFQKRKDAAFKAATKAGRIFPEVEWLLQEHNIHVAYFNSCNNAAETAFGSATNVTTVAYMQKIKPTAEAYYYDVIRHVALISDPDVRNRKEAELRKSIYSALVYALGNVATAHGSFKYHNEWECECDIANLLALREAEQEALRVEENERIQHNMNAKKVFDSGEIPESSPLFKKLDAYGFDFNYIFFKGRMSCARTVVNFNFNLPGLPEIFASRSTSEFTGAATYKGGIKILVGAEQGNVKAGAYFNLSSSVSLDGQGVIKDYSVTAGTGLTVSAKGTTAAVGGELTFGPNGLKDSDFSAGISKDFSNGNGASGNVSFEASTKRGCSISGKVEQTMESARDFIDKSKEGAVGKDMAGMIPTDDLTKKELWSGKFTF